MATKGKDKIIDGQIAFDFMGELEKDKNVETKVAKKVQTRFRKENLNIKHSHFKSVRKVRRIPRKFKRS